MPQIDPNTRFNAYANQPYQPSQPNAGGIEINTTLRVAHALEYIAAQLGQINAKLDRLLPTEPDDKS